MRRIGGMAMAAAILVMAGGAMADDAKPKYPPYPEVWGRVLPDMPDPAVNKDVRLFSNTSAFPTPDGDRELWFKWWANDWTVKDGIRRFKFFAGTARHATQEEWFARHEAWQKSAHYKDLERILTPLGFGPDRDDIRGTFWEPRNQDTRMPAVVLPPDREVITQAGPYAYYQDERGSRFNVSMAVLCGSAQYIFVKVAPKPGEFYSGVYHGNPEAMAWRKVLVRVLDKPKPTVEDKCEYLAQGGETPFIQRVEILSPGIQPLEDGTFLLFPIPSGDGKELYAVRFRDGMESPFLEGRKDLVAVDAALIEPILIAAEHLWYVRLPLADRRNSVSPYQYAHDALYRLITGKEPE